MEGISTAYTNIKGTQMGKGMSFLQCHSFFRDGLLRVPISQTSHLDCECSWHSPMLPSPSLRPYINSNSNRAPISAGTQYTSLQYSKTMCGV